MKVAANNRMGINLGDIAVEDGDFFGDGVRSRRGSKAWRNLGHLLVARVPGGSRLPRRRFCDRSLRALRPSISRALNNFCDRTSVKIPKYQYIALGFAALREMW